MSITMSAQRLPEEVLRAVPYLKGTTYYQILYSLPANTPLEHFHNPSQEYDAVLNAAITGQKLELGYQTIGEWITENPKASQAMKQDAMLAVIDIICKDPIIIAIVDATHPILVNSPRSYHTSSSTSTFTKEVMTKLSALKLNEVPQPSTGHHSVTFSPSSQSKASTPATTASVALPSTFTISKLDNLDFAITYYKMKNITFPLSSGKYSLSFRHPALDSMNLLCPSVPPALFYHHILVKLCLNHSTNKTEEFPALPLGRIQSEGELTKWIVLMKIQDTSLYALRPDIIEGEWSDEELDEGEDLYVDSEDKPLDKDIPEFDGYKAVWFGAISSQDYCTMERLDLISWGTREYLTKEIPTLKTLTFKSQVGL